MTKTRTPVKQQLVLVSAMFTVEPDTFEPPWKNNVEKIRALIESGFRFEIGNHSGDEKMVLRVTISDAE